MNNIESLVDFEIKSTDIDAETLKSQIYNFLRQNSTVESDLLLSNPNIHFTHSPYSMMHKKIIDIAQNVCPEKFVSIRWDIRNQKMIIRVRDFCWLDTGYDRERFISWLYELLPDFCRDIRAIEMSQLADGGKKYSLGYSKQFDLAIVESDSVLLSDEIESIMNKYHYKRLLFAYINKNNNYCGSWNEITQKTWRMEIWQRTLRLTEKGKIEKCILSGKIDSFFFGSDVDEKNSSKDIGDTAYRNFIELLPAKDFEDLSLKFHDSQKENSNYSDFMSNRSWSYLE